jgi:parallel beta-helix repeat protein
MSATPPVSATLLAAPDAPTIAATPYSSTEIDVTVTLPAPLSVDGTLLEQSLTGSAWLPAGTLTNQEHVFHAMRLTPDTRYYFRARAFVVQAGVEVTSPWSPTASATTQAAPSLAPDAPRSLTVEAVSSSRIEGTFTDASGNETSFEVWRAVSGGAFTLQFSLLPNVTTFTDSDLTASTLYAYKVLAKNSAGSSAFSNTASDTTTANISVGTEAFFVATTGNNTTGTGSMASPFKTWARGLQAVKAGGTLYGRGGTYAEIIDSQAQTIPVGTSWANAVTIAAFNKEPVIFRPTSNVSWVLGMIHGYIQYVIFQDLVVDATNAQNGIKVSHGAHHLRWQGVEVKNAGVGSGVTGGQGIQTSLGSGPATGQTFLEFLNMHVHHNGDTGQYDHGFYLETGGSLIDGCNIHHNATFGIQLYRQDSPTLPNNTVIRNCYVHDNAQIGAQVRGGIVVAGPNNFVYNNIIVNNGQEGISIGFGTATGNRFYHNTVCGHGEFGIDVRSGSTACQLTNNIVYGNGQNIRNSGNATLIANLTSNPSFVNAAAGDYHLQKDSAAITSGASLPSMQEDYDHQPRPTNNLWHCGAYQYV